MALYTDNKILNENGPEVSPLLLLRPHNNKPALFLLYSSPVMDQSFSCGNCIGHVAGLGHVALGHFLGHGCA